MKRQGGFTLIELVVVIVILGILAVTAAPRFLNLQDDARASTLDGLRGAVAGAMGISYGKAAIAGIEAIEVDAGDLPATTTEGIVYSFGYPTAAEDGILESIDLSEEFVVLQSSTGDDADHENTTIDIGLTGFTTNCVRYTAATAADEPAEVAVIAGAAGTACGVPAN
ncbi:type II secretion system protein [Vibrio gigantis]|uniref:type II secretion system protein n=1 Tax=Vibrio gigantis TaxID=296199 RepID=UPI001BFD1127|nr:prepilin-type N-terminal cleavage/methylation domain-containing protein [Vibrio gigantis]